MFSSSVNVPRPPLVYLLRAVCGSAACFNVITFLVINLRLLIVSPHWLTEAENSYTSADAGFHLCWCSTRSSLKLSPRPASSRCVYSLSLLRVTDSWPWQNVPRLLVAFPDTLQVAVYRQCEDQEMPFHSTTLLLLSCSFLSPASSLHTILIPIQNCLIYVVFLSGIPLVFIFSWSWLTPIILDLLVAVYVWLHLMFLCLAALMNMWRAEHLIIQFWH